MSCQQVLHDRAMVIGEPIVTLHADLAPVPRAAGKARVLVASALSDGAGRMLDEEAIYSAQLVASELVTNAVMHARTPLQLGLCHDGHTLLIAVADGAPADRVINLVDGPGLTARMGESGRGMAIVAQLADDFGCRQRTQVPGKVMWASLALDGAGHAPQAQGAVRRELVGRDGRESGP